MGSPLLVVSDCLPPSYWDFRC